MFHLFPVYVPPDGGGYSVRDICATRFPYCRRSETPKRVRPFCAELDYGRDNKNNDRLCRDDDGHGRQRDTDDCSSPPQIARRLFTRHVLPNAFSPVTPAPRP